MCSTQAPWMQFVMIEQRNKARARTHQTGKARPCTCMRQLSLGGCQLSERSGRSLFAALCCWLVAVRGVCACACACKSGAPQGELAQLSELATLLGCCVLPSMSACAGCWEGGTVVSGTKAAYALQEACARSNMSEAAGGHSGGSPRASENEQCRLAARRTCSHIANSFWLPSRTRPTHLQRS